MKLKPAQLERVANLFRAFAEPMVFELCARVCDKLNRDAEKPATLKF